MATEQENNISRHYTTDNLLEAINTALLAGGKDPESLNAEDLKGVDEFQPDF